MAVARSAAPRPAEKAMNFKGSLRRLAGLLGPEKWLVYAVIASAPARWRSSVTGPKVLGNATTVVFEGFITGTGIDFHTCTKSSPGSS